MVPRQIRIFLVFLLLAASTAGRCELEPGPAGPVIAQMIARVLEEDHYAHHPIDEKTSQDFLKVYLEAFDYDHMIFLQSDVDEFTSLYGASLGDKIKAGDITPAYAIFNRLLERLKTSNDLVHKDATEYEALYSSHPATALEGDETMVLDRHKMPWAKDSKASAKLWRQRVEYELIEEILDKTKPAEQVKNIVSRYDQLLTSYKQFDATDVLQAYLTSLAHAYDPHSDYMAPAEMDNFNISMQLSLVGIGAELRSEAGYARIVSLVPGGPADKDKTLKPNDKIVAIAQGDEPFLDVVGMKLDRLVELIRGKKGTVVRLKIIPADAVSPATRVVVSLVRDTIKLVDKEAKADVIDVRLKNGRVVPIGRIDLPSFYADMKSGGTGNSSAKDLAALLTELEKRKIEGLILDLRRNGGGSLTDAIRIAGLFLGSGPVVQVKNERGYIRVDDAANPPIIYDGPMVVLTGRESASASEIVSAALQDYGRAVIVGNKSTFGKGTVQEVVDLSQYMPEALASYRPGAIKLTIQKFYRVSGGSTQNKGVIPDVQLPSVEDNVEMTESSLPHAMPYDSIAPAYFRSSAKVDPQMLALLDNASKKRVLESPEFGYVREDIAEYLKHKNEKIVPLNLKTLQAEKEADEQRDEKRKKERLARKDAPLATTAITLESLTAPATQQAQASTPAAVTPSSPEVNELKKALDEAQKSAEPSKATPLPESKIALSSSTAAVAQSSTSAAGYEKSSPAPDVELDESVNILADLVAIDHSTGELLKQAKTALKDAEEAQKAAHQVAPQ